MFCKDIRYGKFKLVAKTQFLCLKNVLANGLISTLDVKQWPWVGRNVFKCPENRTIVT